MGEDQKQIQRANSAAAAKARLGEAAPRCYGYIGKDSLGVKAPRMLLYIGCKANMLRRLCNRKIPIWGNMHRLL